MDAVVFDKVPAIGVGTEIDGVMGHPRDVSSAVTSHATGGVDTKPNRNGFKQGKLCV